MRPKNTTARRITVMIDSDIFPKLHILHANVIKKQMLTYSFSRCINDMILRTLEIIEKNPIPNRPQVGTEGAQRITIMIDKDLRRALIYTMAGEMQQCADDNCDLPTLNFTRVLNNILRKGFHIGVHRTVLSEA